MRTLPTVTTLADACLEVIRSNKADGYPPNYFEKLSQDVPTMSRLIRNPRALKAVKESLGVHPDLLTIEDFVGRHGERWGFDADTVTRAQANVREYDSCVGHPRYA